MHAVIRFTCQTIDFRQYLTCCCSPSEVIISYRFLLLSWYQPLLSLYILQYTHLPFATTREVWRNTPTCRVPLLEKCGAIHPPAVCHCSRSVAQYTHLPFVTAREVWFNTPTCRFPLLEKCGSTNTPTCRLPLLEKCGSLHPPAVCQCSRSVA